MKIIPKLGGKINEYVLNEAELVVGAKPSDSSETTEPMGQEISRIVPKLDKDKDTISVSTDVFESNIQEYKIKDMNRYDTWKDVFTKGVQDEKWRKSGFIKVDSYYLSQNVPFTDSDLKFIEKTYFTPGFITQDVLGAYGVILKNAIGRRSILSEEMKVKITEFDKRLKALVRGTDINKKKEISTTFDPAKIARYLVWQGKDSWAGNLGNTMRLEENEKVIGLMLRKETDNILRGGSENSAITNELYELIKKQSLTKTKAKNKGLDEIEVKDYIPVNELILYAVLIRDTELVNIAISAEKQKIDLQKQGRIKGKFTKVLGTMLSDLVKEEGMEEIKSILSSAGLISSSEEKIIPKLENRTMGKTIIISERQAQILSLLRLRENSNAINATKGSGYTTPKVGGYTAQPGGGTDHAADLEKKRNKGRPAVDATKDQFKPTDKIEKSLIVDKDKVCDTKKLNDYFVKEGVDYYKIVSKKDLLKEFFFADAPPPPDTYKDPYADAEYRYINQSPHDKAVKDSSKLAAPWPTCQTDTAGIENFVKTNIMGSDNYDRIIQKNKETREKTDSITNSVIQKYIDNNVIKPTKSTRPNTKSFTLVDEPETREEFMKISDEIESELPKHISVGRTRRDGAYIITFHLSN